MITAHFYKMGRAAADNRSRGKSYSKPQRGFAARRKCNRQALQLFELPACNANAFLLDGRRPFSFSGKKMGVASCAAPAALLSPQLYGLQKPTAQRADNKELLC